MREWVGGVSALTHHARTRSRSIPRQHDLLRIVRGDGAKPADQIGDRLGGLNAGDAFDVTREAKHVSVLRVLRR